MAAIDEGVPAHVAQPPPCSTGSARGARATSPSKLLSAMRKEFGGHDEKQG